MSGPIVCVVEGHGEVEAVSVLLRRIAASIGHPEVSIGKPVRCARSKLIKEGELERYVKLAVSKGQASGAVLVLLDGDRDCPKELASILIERVRSNAWNRPVSVVLAKCEYEAWFLASIESLRGKRFIRQDAVIQGDPEEILGAKEKIRQLMEPGATYSETLDQPALSAAFDMDQARMRSPSFDKLYRDVQRIAEELARRG